MQMLPNLKRLNRLRLRLILKNLFVHIPVRTVAVQILIVLIIYYIISSFKSPGKQYMYVDHSEDYIGLICGTDEFKHDANKVIRETKSEIDAEDNSVESKIVSVASRMRLTRNMVLFTVINEAYLPFAYSWLCNTKTMDVHQSVLIITTDTQAKEKLNKDWPEINVVSMDLKELSGNQSYSHVGYIKITVKRTALIQSLLMANIDVFVFEVDCLWLANPVQIISFSQDDDIIVNPVAKTDGKIFASGFIWIRSTCRAKIIWQKVTDMMLELGRKVENWTEDTNLDTYGEENEQEYLATLIKEGYGNVTLRRLPLDKYADGQWYKLTHEERSKLSPFVINNNWIIGNKAKIERAKEWNHWFLRDDLKCDMDLVSKTIYTT